MAENSLNSESQTNDQPVETTSPAPEPVMAQSVATGPAAAQTVSNTGRSSRRGVWVQEAAKYVTSVLILAGGIGGMLALWQLKQDPKEQQSDELMTMVGTVNVSAYSGQLDKTISGTVVPYREIRVAAEVSGNVIKKYESCEAGNFVKKGTPLLEIDPEDYRLAQATGQAEVEQSKKQMAETEEEIQGQLRMMEVLSKDYDLAKAEYQRNRRIRDAISSQEFDQSKRTVLNAETTLVTCRNKLEMLNVRAKRMQAALDLAQARLNRTNLSLTKTTIVAPDDGVIVREMAQKGDYVRSGDSLVMFEDTRRSEVICNLTPMDLAWIRTNAPADISLGDDDTDRLSVYYVPKMRVEVYDATEPEVVWEGILERFDGIGRDESTRTIPCRITIDQPIVDSDQGRRALVRGMFVKCRLNVQTSAGDATRQFYAFPAVALQPGNFVWAVKDHKLKRLAVDVVDHAEQLIGEEKVKLVVVSHRDDSVQIGDMIVTTPLSQPSDGTEVLLESEVEKPTQTADASQNIAG